MKQKSKIQNPWAGLFPYEDPAKSSRELKFCGRDSNTYDVTALIDDNFFVTLYGKSGIGKTSLLNAGVFPQLRQKQYTPLNLRLGITDEKENYQDIITKAIERSIAEEGGTINIIPVVEEQTDVTAIDYMWNWFARRCFLNSQKQVTFPVVILDQFEEVFRNITSRRKTEVLLSQLHYLIDESHAINDCIVNEELYCYDFNFRFVLSIREDDLYRLEDCIDNRSLVALKSCRYRLRSLTEKEACDVILLPCQDLFDPEERNSIVMSIIDTARNKEGRSISTNILSLVCYRIYANFQHQSDDYISQSFVDTFLQGNPFEVFYNEATKELTNEEKSYIEDNLVDSSGRRDSISESDFLQYIPKGKILLEGDTRILQRTSVSSYGSNYRVELIHDSFCKPLTMQKEKRKKLKRKKQLVTTTFTIIAFVIILIVITTQAIMLWNSNNKLRKSNNELNIAKKENEKLFDYKMRSEKEKAQKAIKESEKNAAIETAVFTDLSRKKPQREKNDAKPTKNILDASFEKMKGDLASPIHAYKKITREYGISEENKGVSIMNKGISIMADTDSTVYSVHNGVVTSALSLPQINIKMVLIRHGSYISVYSNLKEFSVAVGDKVSAQQPIGKVNDDGILHFQLRNEKSILNPREWLMLK